MPDSRRVILYPKHTDCILKQSDLTNNESRSRPPQRKYLKWVKKIQGVIPEIGEANSKITFRYILDMERGLNIAKGTKKGARGYPRLNNIRQRIIFMIKELEKRFNLLDITTISEERIFDFSNDMRNGTTRRTDGEMYLSVADYVKSFKAF